MKVRIECDKEAFDKYKVWILLPEKLIENYGKINFNTIKFFLEDEISEYKPEGGGPNKYLNVPLVYSHKETVVKFEARDLIPDPWYIEYQIIYAEFELFEI